MARYRLKSAHYLDGDKLLMGDQENIHIGDERGTIVGDGTPHVVKWPTLEMIPLDDEAEEMIERERERLRLNDASMTPVDDLPMDKYEEEFLPGFNTRRRAPRPDGAAAKGGSS